jgi:exopolysaccharide biosynthesis polyprenyl glycosylphosphotransferase
MTVTSYAPGRTGDPVQPARENLTASRPAGAASQPAGPRPRRAGRLTRQMLWPVADLLAVAAVTAVAGIGPGRAACYCALVLIGLAAFGLQRLPICLRATDQAGRLAVAAALPALALAPWLSASRAVLLAAGATVALIAARAAACAALRSAYRRGLLVQRALIIGDCPAGQQLARLLAEHPELGLTACGMLEDRPGRPDDRPGRPGPPVLGRIAEAGPVIDRHGVSQVLVCGPAVSDEELVRALRACRRMGAAVSMLPRLPDLGLAVPRTRMDEVWGVPLIPVRPGGDAPAGRAVKRSIDVVLGATLLVLTAPVTCLLAVAVLHDLRRPAFFRQVRVVGRGRRATITKLRTLRPAGDPDTAWQVAAGQSTAVGRLLRGTHADELPQLASVLRGDMSLVGPRPERPHFARQLAGAIPGYADRERVTAGLTGWAQVHGLSGDTSIEDRARFDNFYIEYWSAWLDLLILARTVPAALSGALRSARGGSS